MQSLEELNTYSQTQIEFGDDRPFETIFDLTTPVDQTLEVFENQSFALPTGIEILEIIDAENSAVEYIIDMTALPIDIELDFGTLPAGVTVTQSPTNYWVVDGITTAGVWNLIKSPTVSFEFGTTGTASATTQIEYTLPDSSRGIKETDITVNVTAIDYMDAGDDQEYAPYEAGFSPTDTPTIIADTGSFDPVYTLSIAPSTTAPIESMSVVGNDSAVFTSITDTLVITGEKDEINSALSTLQIDFTGINEDFDLIYTLTNDLDDNVDIEVQEFVSESFAATVSSTFGFTSAEPVLEKAFFAEATVNSATTTIATGVKVSLETQWTKTLTGSAYWGQSLGFDGDYVIAGEPDHDNQSVTKNGRIHIYNSSGVSINTIENPNTATSTSDPRFGSYVAADSGIGVTVSANTSGNNFFAYDLSTGNLNWSSTIGYSTVISIGNGKIVTKSAYNSGSGLVTRLQLYNASNGNLLDTYDFSYFSSSSGIDTEKHLDIYGDNLIVGMPKFNAGGGNYAEGKAYVFDLSGDDFNLTYTVDNPSPAPSPTTPSGRDEFGYSVSISDSRFLVGVPLEDPSGQSSTYNNGKTYVYNLSSGSLTSTIDNPDYYVSNDDNNGDYFGWWVDSAANDSVIVARNEDNLNDANDNEGVVYYYDHINQLYHVFTPTIPSADGLVWCAEISGDYFVVGQPSNTISPSGVGKIQMIRYVES